LENFSGTIAETPINFDYMEVIASMLVS